MNTPLPLSLDWICSVVWSPTKETNVLSEYARRLLKRSIAQTYAGDANTIRAFALEPAASAAGVNR